MSDAALMQLVFENGMRVGSVIHLASMLLPCVHALPEQVAEFIQHDLDEDTLARIDAVAPGLQLLVEEAQRDSNADVAETFAEAISEHEHIVFIVSVEWKSATCVRRGDRFPFGLYDCSWGRYRSGWYPGASIDECVRAALIDVLADKHASWEAAPVDAAAPTENYALRTPAIDNHKEASHEYQC